MFLLDVKEPSLVMLLLGAISALVAAVVWLALYIRKLHNRMNELSTKHTNEIREMAAEVKEIAVNVAEVVQDVRATVAGNTKAVEWVGKAVERVGDVADDLHKTIIQNILK